ncbi:AAA family ATPase [Rhizobium sp. RAF56]|uniref:AAA family ATPase n=1 Tax=Rhizobium sp. RAF56 TaxID=3233062 RepID=UPI003F96806F
MDSTDGGFKARKEEIDDLIDKLGRAAKAGLNGSGGAHYGGGQAEPEEKTEPLVLFDAADIGDIDKLPPTQFILGDNFAKGYVSSIIATGGTGKTAVRIAQALSIVTGKPLTGEELFLQCKVLFVCFEDSIDQLKKRIGAAMRHYGIKDEDVRGRLLYAVPGRKSGKLVEADLKGRPRVGALKEYLEKAIAETGAEFICLDPLKKLHGVGENDNTGMDEVIGVLADIAIEMDVAIDAPQHARKNMSKDAAEAGSADQARGASSTVDAMRFVKTLMKMTPKEAQQFAISEGVRKLYVRTDTAKLNLVPPSREATWFKLTGVALANATASYGRSDNIVVAERWQPPSLWLGLDASMQERILSEIEKGMDDGEKYSIAANVGKRCVSNAFAKHDATQSKADARLIVKEFIKGGLLREDIYENGDRKKVKGLVTGPFRHMKIDLSGVPGHTSDGAEDEA